VFITSSNISKFKATQIIYNAEVPGAELKENYQVGIEDYVCSNISVYFLFIMCSYDMFYQCNIIYYEFLWKSHV